MNEKEMRGMMRNLDGEFLERELDVVMDGIEVDVESILDKSVAKLEKEQKKMKKSRWIPIVAAAVCVVVGTSAAYASEISDFVKSFFDQSTPYSTVVDGTAYYLEAPVKLSAGGTLNAALFASDQLELALDAEFTGIKVNIGGTEYEAGGYSEGPKGKELYFYEIPAAPEFTLVLDGKSQTISLTRADSAVDNGEIQPESQTPVDWVNMGYKMTGGGVRIFTSFDDGKIQLVSIGCPEVEDVTGSFENRADGSMGSSTSPLPLPLYGYDVSGKAYEYATDPDDMGRPLTVFYSDAPSDENIILKIPSIVVGYDKAHSLDISLPSVGETDSLGKDLDFGLESMRLDTVERTSGTTARLTFTLDTGSRQEVSFRNANLYSSDLNSGNMTWKDGVCVMEIEFDSNLDSFALGMSYPTFVVDGDWELALPGASR